MNTKEWLKTDEGKAWLARKIEANRNHHVKKRLEEGSPCRKCGHFLVKRIPKHKKLRQGQTIAYRWYLRCPHCHDMYMPAEAMYAVGSNDTPWGPLIPPIPEKPWDCARCLHGIGRHCTDDLVGGCRYFAPAEDSQEAEFEYDSDERRHLDGIMGKVTCVL